MLSILTGLSLSYLLGSIPTGFLIGKWIAGIDIRKHGSGNVGATNVFRTVGKRWGIAALLFDIFKGFAASYGCVFLLPAAPSQIEPLTFQIFCGLFAIVGHTWPVWLKFKGGKGVATSCGVFLGILPKAILGSFFIWTLSAILTRYVSLSSIVAAFSFLLWLFVFYRDLPHFFTLLAVAIAIFFFILYTHRSNIKRLLQGQEHKIGEPRNRSIPPESSS